MASPDILDFEALLQPITDESPGGENLREDVSPTSVYYQIKDARAAARAAERAAIQMGELEEGSSPHWRTILDLGPEALGTRSKDLEIVAWLTEALVRRHGFAGLRDGYRLARELVERFWDDLHPMPDEDGIETRVAPLTGLNGEGAEGTLQVPIALAPMTEEGDQGAFCLWRYRQAQEVSKIDDSELVEQRVKAGDPTLEQFHATVLRTSRDFFTNLLEDIDAALEHFAEMSRLLDEHCGASSPPSSNVRNSLTDARDTIRYVMVEIGGHPDPSLTGADEDATADEEGAAGENAVSPASASASGEIRSREDAFRMLTRISDYFLQAEPHSPLGSVLNQAVRWGQLPLERLVEELIPDLSARAHFSMLTGLRRIDDDGASSDPTDDL